MKRTLAVVAAASLAAAATAEAVATRRHVAAEATRYVDAGGYQVAVTVRGLRPTPETPAVVVVVGAGDVQASWTAVAHRLAADTQVVTYDRAGLGGSEAGPAPTADRYVAELQAVLDACLPEGRYVLVGHSLGGFIARLHAQQHSERLAGLVQVDATPDEVAEDRGVQIGFAVSGVLASVFKALAPLGLIRLLLALRAFPLYPEQRAFEARLSPDERRAWVDAVDRSMGPGGAAGPELRSVLPCAREAQQRIADVGRPQFGDLPLAVLSSHARGSERWVGMHRELAARSRAATHREFDDRFHNIHMAHPDAVVDAVDDVLRGRLLHQPAH
ncbi:alpha/beta hydrolase [Geodermatophilus sp. URMC 62]|uniref:alpha/beta hydrolase n=1 Tax=Geodermatophilus sp. URMC 62 TaxID=3423414 RepID=UPI00406BF5F3